MRFLLIGPYGIGNTILSLPAMRILRDKFENHQIDLLCLLPSVYEMVYFLPDFRPLFGDIFLLPPILPLWEKLGRLHTLFKARYDHSILLFPSAKLHYNLLSYLIHARERIGSKYPDINLRRGHFSNTVNVPVVVGIHDVYQNIHLLAPFGIDYKSQSIQEIRSRWIRGKGKAIGFHPGSKKREMYRRWGADKFVVLVQWVLKEFITYKVKLFFGPDEVELVGYFKGLAHEPRVHFIVGQPLRKVFDEINECEIFISNDSGLMHIANFLGCYTISIWGPSDFRRTGPFNEPKKIIYCPLPCRPCAHTYEVSSHRFTCIYETVLCMEQIGVEEVLQAVREAVASAMIR